MPLKTLHPGLHKQHIKDQSKYAPFKGVTINESKQTYACLVLYFAKVTKGYIHNSIENVIREFC